LICPTFENNLFWKVKQVVLFGKISYFVEQNNLFFFTKQVVLMGM